jgi:hypothetical protein
MNARFPTKNIQKTFKDNLKIKFTIRLLQVAKTNLKMMIIVMLMNKSLKNDRKKFVRIFLNTHFVP